MRAQEKRRPREVRTRTSEKVEALDQSDIERPWTELSTVFRTTKGFTIFHMTNVGGLTVYNMNGRFKIGLEREKLSQGGKWFKNTFFEF